MIIGYRKSDFTDYGLKLPIELVPGKRFSHILICGKSGSGKSLAGRWWIYQILRHREGSMYLADFKGGEEYETLEGSGSYSSGQKAIEMIHEFYEFFTQVRQNHIRLKQYYGLYIEEWMGLITYAESHDKKLKASLMSELGEILALGRGYNIGITLTLQRADANLFQNGTREQFQVICAFGRCSTEAFRMLGFSGEMEENPTFSYRPGQALVLMDGQESIEEVIVPMVTNEKTMNEQIRYYLDQQPDLASLTRAIAEGRGPGL